MHHDLEKLQDLQTVHDDTEGARRAEDESSYHHLEVPQGIQGLPHDVFEVEADQARGELPLL